MDIGKKSVKRLARELVACWWGEDDKCHLLVRDIVDLIDAVRARDVAKWAAVLTREKGAAEERRWTIAQLQKLIPVLLERIAQRDREAHDG